MNSKKIFMSLLLAAGMTACINDADVDNSSTIKPPVVEGQENTTFNFVVPNSTGGRSAEDSGDHDLGSPEEYKVNKVRLFLFSESTGNLYRTFDVEGLSTPVVNGNNVSYTSNSVTLDPGTYRIFALANADNSLTSPATINGLLAEIDKKSYANGEIGEVPTGGFIMTNRGASSPVATITTDNHTTVNITLERVVAKLMLGRSQDNYPLTDSKGYTYATIVPTNYSFVNLSKHYYLYRHVATLANAADTPPAITDWDLNTNFTTIPDVDGYAIDPYFFDKTVAGAASFNGSIFANPLSAAGSLTFSGSFPAAGEGNFSSFYCLENCMFRPAQLQAYTTGAVIKCNITIPEDHCFNEDGTTVPSKDHPNTLYYFNYNFYTSLKAVKEVGKANIPATENPSDKELAEYSIKRFNKSQGSYNCYYNYWIRHLDNGMPTYMGVMEYGIVRNNMYQITITSINGLGEGTPNTDPEIPDEKKGYLDATIDVDPWIVRSQNGNLE